MATLTNTKIKDTYPGLLKITDNGIVEATEQVVTDGLGNNTTLSIGTASASVAGTLSFGSLKDTGENITITKFVDEADGISANDNDTSIPTSAAVKNYVDNAIPTEADTLATVTARGASTNTAITVQGIKLYAGDGVGGSLSLGDTNNLSNNTTGEFNLAIGYISTLRENTTGSQNVAIGDLALRNNTSGSKNTALGTSTLFSNTEGSQNVAIGTTALYANTTGVNNLAIGFSALDDNASGSDNVSIGNNTLASLSTGSFNVALGSNSGGNVISGSSNVYLGYNADAGGTGSTNEIVIGANITGNGSNTATYGNASIVEHHFTAGDVYMNADLFGLEVIGNAFGATEYIRLTGGQLNFGTNGGDKVTIDSSGNVGIGESNPAFPLHIKSSTDIVQFESTTNGLYNQYKSTAGIFGYVGSGSQTVSGGGTTDFGIQAPLGSLIIATGGNTERMRIDSSGNVGIGTSSPSGTSGYTYITLNSAVNGTALSFRDNNTETAAIYYTNSNSTFNIDGVKAGSQLVFRSSLGERMRITSGGDVYVGNQGNLATENGWVLSPSGGGGLTANFSGTNEIFTYNQRDGAGTTKIDFRNGNVGRGNITWTTSGTSFNTSSDYRLKENVVELTEALDRVDALKPSRFNFIADPEKTVDGFLAHEVAEVIPEAITGEKDAVDEEGNPVYQGIDQSKITPLLTAAIKELKALVEAQQQEINNLKSQING